MSNIRPGVVVVGVDGTSVGRAALTFAMREASRRGSELRVVTTWTWNVNAAGFDAGIAEEPAEIRTGRSAPRMRPSLRRSRPSPLRR
jgi:hypothetical protein